MFLRRAGHARGGSAMDQQSVRRERIIADAVLLVGTCAIVVSASLLGLDALRQTVLGIPAGIWVVGIVFAGHRAVRHCGSLMRRAEEPPRIGTLRLASIADPDDAWTPDAIPTEGRQDGSAVHRLVPAVGALGVRLRGLIGRERPQRREAQGIKHESQRTPDRRASGVLRVALDLPQDQVRAIMEAPGLEDIQWLPTTGDSGTVPDAIVERVHDGRLVIVTPQDDEHPAAWPDWSMARPLSFATAFPVRIDPGTVTIDVGSELSTSDAELVRAAVDAAAVLSRTPARLAKDHPGRGRRARPRMADENALVESRLRRVMLRLCHLLSRDVRQGRAARAHVPIARACAAWLCTSDLEVDLDLRREGVEAACQVLGRDAESLLRAAAVRIADGDDQAAIEALRAAMRAIPSGAIAPSDDTMTYVQAEIDFGSRHADLSLGRIASGLCMIASASDAARIDFLRDDLAEDLRYSPWLLGRDADQRLVLDVLAMLAAERQPATRSEAA